MVLVVTLVYIMVLVVTLVYINAFAHIVVLQLYLRLGFITHCLKSNINFI